jgi:hypothetical protein
MDLLTVAIFFAIAAGGYVAADSFARSRARRAPAGPAGEPTLDVAMLEIAMPSTRLAALRAGLEGASPYARPPGELGKLLRALREEEAHWTHVGVRSFPLGAADAAHDRFTALVREARARGTLDADPAEGAERGYRTAGSELPGPSLSLVTIVALATREIPEAPPASRPAATILLGALERIASAHPDTLMATDVVWLPERTIDGLTQSELEGTAARLVAVASAQR